MGCELFFLLDKMGNRMNTVFKLYYQVWLMLAIVSTIAFYHIMLRWSPPGLFKYAKYLWTFIFILLVLGCLSYPAMYITQLANKASTNTLTLDGLDFLKRSNPLEKEAVDWMNNHIRGSPVIAEAAGPSYSEYGRISAWTGLPCIINWSNHELIWRGSSRLYRGREDDVAALYSSRDKTQVISIIKKYNIEYVYLGGLERLKYGTGAGSSLSELMDIAFNNKEVIIYQVRK